MTDAETVKALRAEIDDLNDRNIKLLVENVEQARVIKDLRQLQTRLDNADIVIGRQRAELYRLRMKVKANGKGT